MMLVKGIPNKKDICSDPAETDFEYTLVDNDGIRWFAVPTETPSAFVEWARYVRSVQDNAESGN